MTSSESAESAGLVRPVDSPLAPAVVAPSAPVDAPLPEFPETGTPSVGTSAPSPALVPAGRITPDMALTAVMKARAYLAEVMASAATADPVVNTDMVVIDAPYLMAILGVPDVGSS